MPKSFVKYKLLLDENMPQRQVLSRLNEHFDIKHIKLDLHFGGMDDSSIYRLAIEQRRIILTRNVKDFRPLLQHDSPGIIGIPQMWPTTRIDSKLTAFLMKHPSTYFRGRVRLLARDD